MSTIIAEIGSCWYDPDSEVALQNALGAIDQASICDADAVKFQLFRADSLYSKERAPKNYETVKKYELPLEWLDILSKRAFGLRLQFGVSVFSKDMVDCAADTKYCSFIKIASGDMTNEELLRYACKKVDVSNNHLRLMVSTGAATLSEVMNMLRIINGYMFARYATVFHCVSSYPSKPHEMNLSVRRISNEIRGLSDHTKGNVVAQIAVGAGYHVFEKHVNLSGNVVTPDDVVAVNAGQFVSYIASIRQAEEIMGFPVKVVQESESSERVWARRGKDGLRPDND